MIQLAPPTDKEDVMKMASYVHPKKVQHKNRRSSKGNSIDKECLLTRDSQRQSLRGSVGSTPKTSEVTVSKPSSPGVSSISSVFQRGQRNKLRTPRKIPQIYQDLENSSELDSSQSNAITPHKFRGFQNTPLKEIQNIMKHNVLEAKTRTLKHSRKLDLNKENFQLNTCTSGEIKK